MEGPETFSSEIGDLHEGRPNQPDQSFDGEFVGAGDSMLRDRRPPTALESSGGGKKALIVLAVLLAVGGGAGWAVWHWWEPIRAQLGLAGADGEQTAEDAGEAGDAVATNAEVGAETGDESGSEDTDSGDAAEPSEGEGEGEGETEAPEPASTETGEPPEPAGTETGPAPEPTPAAPKVEILSTAVRGRVSQSTIESKLVKVDQALDGCWADAVGAGAKGPIELVLKFSIRWNRKASAIKVTGEGASSELTKCVRRAVPVGGWPEPRDLGTAHVTRRWTLTAGP